jgi:CO/xanthine dehydrogenase FAD-binding subunit
LKPAPFVYHDPPDLESAMRLLAELGPGAKVLAGGQSLMPMLNFRIARPDHLIDLCRIPGLSGVEVSNSRLVMGAMTTHRMVETSPVVRATAPLLSEAVAHVAHIPIRERGTLGGSLSLADPAAELPLASVVLDAEITMQSVRGQRTVPAVKFFHSALQTELADDEILTSVSFPALGAEVGVGSAFAEFSRREGDFAIVGVAVVVGVRAGRYESVRIGLCGVSDRPFRSAEAECLVGEPVSEQTTNRIAEAIAAEIAPADDVYVRAQDRRDIARALIRRTLTHAAKRAAIAAPTKEGTTR